MLFSTRDFPRLTASLGRAIRALSLGLALASASGAHAASEPERTDLFTQKVGGFFSYRIPGIVVTAKGTVLAYCEARRHTGSDWDDMENHLRRSTDGGKTWSPAQKIASHGPHLPRNPFGHEAADNVGGPDEQTVNNPLMIADRDGTVHFIYCIEYMRAFYVRSTDDGVTWSEPVEITSAFEGFRKEVNWQRIATGPGHGIQLKSGRLLIPVWFASHDKDTKIRGAASVIYSDDRGATWQSGEIAVRSPGEINGVSECIATELGDGRVLLNVRNRDAQNRRLSVYSADGVSGWTKPQFHPELLEPVCMAGLLTHPGTGTGDARKPFLVFSNPDTLDHFSGKAKPGERRDRKNLALKLSYDDGATWPVSKVLEPGPSAYSDLAVLPDGTILCFYESGKPGVARPGAAKRGWPYATLTVARIDPAWLTDQAKPE